MPDDVRRLSAELARDPASLAFIPLGEALRRQGQLDMARKVALRGLEKHPHLAEAHDLLGRIHAEEGEHERAFDEWDMVLRLRPGHAGALKGMGFIRFQQGSYVEAERLLGEAQAADPSDASIAAALAHVREHGGSPDAAPRAGARLTPRPTSAQLPPMVAAPDGARAAQQARSLFADLLGEGGQTALLLDAEGFVLAGAYVTQDGRDVGQDVGAQLSGLSDEASRAMRHLGMGAWTSIVFETEVATFALAPGPREGLLLVAADRQTPIGLARRVLERAADRARSWVAAMTNGAGR